jgi:hypothetical protein
VNVKSIIDCCRAFDCHVGTPGVFISIRLFSSNQFLCCVAWPLVEPSSDQFAWCMFQSPVYIAICCCGTGICLTLSIV